MAEGCLLFTVLLLSSGISRGRHYEGMRQLSVHKHGFPGSPKEKSCTEEREVVRSMEFKSLAPRNTIPVSIGETSFLEFNFALPVLVLGWKTRGRAGAMYGSPQHQAGFVDSYMVTYITKKGRMQQLVNPVSKREEFISHGNLATPDVASEVSLPKPLEVTSMRFTPLAWSGVPYLEVRLIICSTSFTKMIIHDALEISNMEERVIGEEAKKVNEDLLLLQADLTGRNVETEDSDQLNTMMIEQHAKTLKEDLRNLKSDLKEKVIEDAIIKSAEFPKDMLLMRKRPNKLKAKTVGTEDTESLKDLAQSELAFKAVKAIEKGGDVDDDDNVLVLETRHSESQSCRQPEEWRYSAQTTPCDIFSARGNSDQAWRAVYDIGYVPYLFPSDTPSHHRHRLLEITFHHRSLVLGLKVAGVSKVRGRQGESDWGAVTRFSLLYKFLGGEWDYYADLSGIPRMFQTGATSKSNAKNPVVFHLPKALKTDAIGIFPHDWVHKPYLSIDILACYLLPEVSKQINKMELELQSQPKAVDEKKPDEKVAVDIQFSTATSVPPECLNSLIGRSGKPKRLLFTNLHGSLEFENQDGYATISMSQPRKVTALMVAAPIKERTGEDGVIVFVLKYRDKTSSPRWTDVVTPSGNVKMFDTTSKGKALILMLPSPVVADELQVIPEKWSGVDPVMFIDLLGCAP